MWGGGGGGGGGVSYLPPPLSGAVKAVSEPRPITLCQAVSQTADNFLPLHKSCLSTSFLVGWEDEPVPRPADSPSESGAPLGQEEDSVQDPCLL